MLAASIAAAVAAIAGAPSIGARVYAAGSANALSYKPTADAYVSAKRPRTNFGRARTLAVRARPAARAFLKFDLRKVGGTGPRAVLKVWSRTKTGFTVRALGAARWRERRITWRNAPRVRPRSAKRVGRASGKGWVTVDVTGAVAPGAVATLVLVPTGGRGIAGVASRESSRAPRLILTSGTGPPPPTKNACGPAYSLSSPWNTPIAGRPELDPNSQQYVNYLTQNSDDRLLTSDPTQYSYPVFYVDATTPTRTVRGGGTYSNVSGSGSTLAIMHPFTVSVPVPLGTAAANGSDGQAVIINPATGDEWAFWQLEPDTGHPGDYSATNGYHYNINWNGVPPKGFGSRGPGMTYLAGLIRPCEIMQGHIDHAIAFAFRSPSGNWVYPATKSDGNDFGDAYPTVPGVTMRVPEGGRYQLDPSLTDDQLGPLKDKHGNTCSSKNPDGSWKPTACLVIAHALQRYGMIVADHAGRSKIYAEYSDCDVVCTGWTAYWGQTIAGVAIPALDEYTANAIPLAKMRVLKLGPLNP